MSKSPAHLRISPLITLTCRKPATRGERLLYTQQTLLVVCLLAG
ncbi:hypothetical protein ACFRAQ_06855 [Nocardia sp. NPDC056611]